MQKFKINYQTLTDIINIKYGILIEIFNVITNKYDLQYIFML